MSPRYELGVFLHLHKTEGPMFMDISFFSQTMITDANVFPEKKGHSDDVTIV